MATETIIPESLCLKTGEREDNALSSESLEENVKQLPGNKVKQLQSGPNQPLETSSQVVETVNTQLETGIPTNESGTFFQALSIPKVSADEHINTPESCVSTTTEDQEVRKMTDIEASTEGKPNEEQVIAVALKETFANEQQLNKGDQELVEEIPAQTLGSIGHASGKELEQVTDIFYKDESTGGSLNTKLEAVNNEGKEPEFLKTKESIKEDTEDVTPGVETEDQGLHEGATDDVCVSTEIKHEEETIKNEEKNDETKEGSEESGPEKAESELSDSIVPSKKEALDTLEKDQGDSEGVTSSQDATCDDIKETVTGQHATTVAELDQNERPRELIKEQIEDKLINAQEANELYENEVKGEGEQKPEESVKTTEEEEEIDKIRPSVEIEEKVDQNELLHAITTDACLSTQTKSQVDTIEHVKKDEEEATQSDDGQKEKSDSTQIKEVCEDNSSEKVELEKEQEVNVLDKDQDEVGIASTQDIAFEGGIQEKNHHSEGNMVSTGVCISTQTEPDEETTENEEKSDEDVIESDDGNTKSSGSPMVKEICEETVSEKAESDEVLKSSDSFSMVLNENEIVSKDEDQEKEQVQSQTESQIKTKKLEEGHEEEVIKSNHSQKENLDNLSVKEVCEETESEKVEPERSQLSDSSSIKLNEKAGAILNKDEVQGKEQDQVEDDVTCLQDATSIEELQGKHHEDIGKEPESDMIRESLEIDSKEMRSSVETSLKREYEGSLHDGVTTDVCVSTQTELEKESSKNEEKAIEMDVCEETSPENAESEGRLELSDNMPPSKKEALSTLEKDQGDSQGVISSQDASVGGDFEEQDQNGRPREFLKEDTEDEDKSADAQKANEQCENRENDKIEENPEESVKHNDQEKEQDVNKLEEDQGEDDVTSAQDLPLKGGLQEKTYQSEANNHEVANAKKSIEEDTEEIRSTVETPDSSEQQTLTNTNSTDVCISTQTQTEPEEETTENKEKNDEEAIGSEDGSLVIKKINEETVSEKAESKNALKPSESPGIELNEDEIVSKDEDQEKEQDLYISERGQSGGDDVTNSENASNEDIKETTIGENVTTVAYFEEGQAVRATPKEIIKEETEDKLIDAQEATKQCDDGTKDDVEQKEEESANETANSSSKIEQAEYIEELKPSVETNEKKDVCISTKIEYQEEATKNEEKAIDIDIAQKEKSDNLLVKEVCEEIDLSMSESTQDISLSDSSNVEINEKAITSLKDQDQEKDQEVIISTEDQGKDNDTSLQHVASEEEGLQEQKGEFVKTRESIDEDTEETKSSDETKENVIATDVCSSTKTEPIEETTGSEEKNDEEAIENDDEGQTKKPESPLFKEVCKATISEKVDSEVQGDGDELISSHNASNEEIKEETSGQHATTVAYFEEGQGVSALTKEILKEEAENKPIEAREEVKQCENEAMDKREENYEESVNEPIDSLTVEGGINEDEVDAGNKEIEAKLDAENQTDRTEDISEMKDEVVSKEKMSLELGQPKEQNVEEIQACLFNTISENSEYEIIKEDGDLSHESVGDTNYNTAKEEKCTLEHEPIEEQHGGVDEVSKEKNINLNETKVEPQEDIIPSSSSGIPTEDTSISEKENAESEILPIEDLKTVSEVQIPELVTKSEDSKLKEECLITETATYVDEEEGALTKEISSDEKTEHTKEIKQETVKEEYEGISSEKAEFEEGLKLSDSSNMQIKEKSITSFKDDNQEKDREVNMSAEGQDKDDVFSSQNKISEEEDLQENNYHNEDNDCEFGRSKESVEEDTEEIKPSVGTNENTEQKELLHVVATDDCSSTHTEHKEETTEKEEKNDEEVIENDEVEDKSIDIQEAFEQHENEAKDKREQKLEEPANSCSETFESNIQKDEADAVNNTEIEAKLNAENQADRGEDGSEMKDEAVSTEKMPTDLGQPNAQSVEKIQACLTETKSEKTEDDITEMDEDISHENAEVMNDNNIKEEKSFLDGRTREIEISTLEHEPVEEETVGPDEVSKENFTILKDTTVEAQEDIKLSSSLGTSTEDVEFVSEVQSPEVVPMSEESKPKEECLISETTTYVDEEKETATKELPSDENLEPYGSTQKSENLKSTTEENITQLENIGEINSVYEKRDMEEDVTKENQVNSEENCSEMVKDAILTEEVPLEIEKEKEINDYEEQVVEEDNYSTELQTILAQNQKKMTHEMSSSDPIPARNSDATEVKVEDKEDISCESKVKNDGVDEEPKEERILSLEDSATIKPQVDLSNTDSTAHLSESEKLATQVLESVCDVQTPEVVADSADSKVKEECVALATDEYMDKSNVEEEQKIKTYEVLVASDTEQENVKPAPTKIDEVKSDDLNIEEKALTKEDLELHGELKLTSELMLEEDRAIETEPQPEQPHITSENITSDQTLESKLQHTSGKHLEDEKSDTEEDATLTPESQIKSIDNQDETTKNVILNNDVSVEMLNESGKKKVIGQISEEDNCPIELDNTSVPDQKELANKIEYLKPIPAGNTEVTEFKADSQIELENIQAAEDLSCLSKAFSAENKNEAPNLEFEKKDKDEELISEVQTAESILKMEMKQEHPETTNDTFETLMSGESSEKKLVSMVPPEELTSLTAEDQTNELVLETDNTKVEHSSISNRDWNPQFIEEFSKTPSEDQKSIKERYIEEEGKSDFGVESKEAKSGNEIVEDVNANEVLLEVEKATESKSIKENINEEASFIHNQSPLATDEVCQIKRLNSSPNEFLETKDVVEGKTDMILMAENLNVKDEEFTVMKEPNEDMKHNFENRMTEEKTTKTDATKEKETLEAPQTDDPVKTVSDSISSYKEQDVQVGSDDKRGHGDMHKLEENSTEDFEITSEETEIVPEGKEASTNLTDDLPEASPKMLLAEQDQEITTTTEKIEEKINDEDGTVVNMYSSTSTKDVACLSSEKNGEIQVSSLNSEIDEGKKNGSGDMMNIEREAVQPQEHISKIKFVDPPSDVEIREQEVVHYGSQEPSEDKTLLSQSDKKTEDPLILQSVEKDIIQGVDKRFDEASVIDVQKQEKDFDHEGTSTDSAIIEDVKKPDVGLKPDMDATADKAEQAVLKEDLHFESTDDGSKITEEVSGMKQEQLELDSPVTPDTEAKEDLQILQKNATDDLIIISHVQPEIQKNEVSDCTVDEQSPNKPHQNESTESKLLAGKIDASHEQGEPTAKSLIAEAEDLKSAKASSTEPQCSSELLKEDTKTNDEKEMFETTEPAQILFADVMHEPTKGNSEVAENLIGERESVVANDLQVDKEEIDDSEVKKEKENEDDEEDNEDNQKMGSCSDAPVMVEASKDMEPKVHKKSHNILSGVGSKVKHSIAKVKKAITGKPSN